MLAAFRRAAFNVLAGNRDDHGKNHGFLLKGQRWELSPAFDLTFVSRATLPERGMSVAGERAAAGADELRKLAQGEGLDRRLVADVLNLVAGAIRQWGQFADEAGVPKRAAEEIGQVLRQNTSAIK